MAADIRNGLHADAPGRRSGVAIALCEQMERVHRDKLGRCRERSVRAAEREIDVITAGGRTEGDVAIRIGHWRVHVAVNRDADTRKVRLAGILRAVAVGVIEQVEKGRRQQADGPGCPTRIGSGRGAASHGVQEGQVRGDRKDSPRPRVGELNRVGAIRHRDAEIPRRVRGRPGGPAID